MTLKPVKPNSASEAAIEGRATSGISAAAREGGRIGGVFLPRLRPFPTPPTAPAEVGSPCPESTSRRSYACYSPPRRLPFGYRAAMICCRLAVYSAVGDGAHGTQGLQFLQALSGRGSSGSGHGWRNVRRRRVDGRRRHVGGRGNPLRCRPPHHVHHLLADRRVGADVDGAVHRHARWP